MFLSGKVVVDDGTPLTEPAAIQTICRGQKHTEAHTDLRGSFSFQISGQASSAAGTVGEAEDSSESARMRQMQRDWRGCEVQASLTGFTSDTVELSSRMSSLEGIDVGRIVLHRLGKVEGFTISATSAAAPDKARKAYEKGLDHEKKSKWDAAQQSLQKAVEIYPRYAVAWLELGRVELKQNDSSGARHCFQQSLDADPRFISPYQELAMISAHDKQWQEVADFSQKMISLNPLLPVAWYLNSAADYNLQKNDEAEKSVRQGLKLDEEHRIPRMEYLLAVILMQKQDFPNAAEHLRNYLQFSPKAEDAEKVRAQLVQVEKLTTAKQAAAAPPK